MLYMLNLTQSYKLLKAPSWQCCRTYGLDLSIITEVRRAAGRRHPAAAKPASRYMFNVNRSNGELHFP